MKIKSLQKTIKHLTSFFSELLRIILTFVVVSYVQSCDTDKGKDNPESSDKKLQTFVFTVSKNPNLTADIYANIFDNKISSILPEQTDISKLIATFTYKGAKITVNGVPQISGVTVNDYRKPLEFVIEAEDKSTIVYTAEFIVASEKEHVLSRFEAKRSLNPGLTEDIFFSVNNSTKIIEASHLKWINSPTPSQFIVSFEAKEATVKINGAEATSGVTVVDFKNPVHVETVWGSYEPRNYTASIVCPQINASLPILRIDADAPITSKDYYVKARLEIVGNGITAGLWSYSMEKIEIRLRGNATMGLPKKPYRIKFPAKYSPLGLNHAMERSWVLLANDCDKSLIRNAVAFQISRILQTGASYRKFAPCTQFVDVYMNGQYDGNYHLTDQVEIGKGRADVQSLKASDAGNASKISGGYLIEIDGFANSEPLRFTSPKGMKVSIKYPDSDDYAPEQVKWIGDFFTKAENALFSSDFKHPVNGWRKHIDAASWVDYCITNELSGNSDAWWSTYMSKERNVDYFVAGPVWDFDIAFNNDNRISNATLRLMAEAAHDPKTWINRFMQDETFKAAIKARWNEKKSELFKINDYIDRLVEQINMSQQANFRRWSIYQQSLGHAGPAPSSYEEAIRILKKYFNDRYEFLDKEFNKW